MSANSSETNLFHGLRAARERRAGDRPLSRSSYFLRPFGQGCKPQQKKWKVRLWEVHRQERGEAFLKHGCGRITNTAGRRLFSGFGGRRPQAWQRLKRLAVRLDVAIGFQARGQIGQVGAPKECAGFWFVSKAHPSAHIGICAGGCNTCEAPKDDQDVELFFFRGS